MTAKQEFLVEGIVCDMTKCLMDEYNTSQQATFGFICNSNTFENSPNPATGLCMESSAYIYDLFELRIGKKEDYSK